MRRLVYPKLLVAVRMRILKSIPQRRGSPRDRGGDSEVGSAQLADLGEWVRIPLLPNDAVKEELGI